MMTAAPSMNIQGNGNGRTPWYRTTSVVVGLSGAVIMLLSTVVVLGAMYGSDKRDLTIALQEIVRLNAKIDAKSAEVKADASDRRADMKAQLMSEDIRLNSRIENMQSEVNQKLSRIQSEVAIIKETTIRTDEQVRTLIRNDRDRGGGSRVPQIDSESLIRAGSSLVLGDFDSVRRIP